MKKEKISRLKRGDEFEYNDQKYVVFNTVVGFGSEVVAKSVKNGQSIRIHKDVLISVG